MRLLYIRKRFRRTEKFCHSYRGWSRAVFGRSWLDWFRPCPTIFELVQKPDSGFPFKQSDKKDWYRFTPLLDHIDRQPYCLDIAHNDTMRGKIKVEHYFSAWYSTFMHDDPAEGIMERQTLRISFSHKPSAMLFKMMYAGSGLKVIQLAHS